MRYFFRKCKFNAHYYLVKWRYYVKYNLFQRPWVKALAGHGVLIAGIFFIFASVALFAFIPRYGEVKERAMPEIQSIVLSEDASASVPFSTMEGEGGETIDFKDVGEFAPEDVKLFSEKNEEERLSYTLYVVKKGDTMWDIAKANSLAVDSVAGANKNFLKNSSTLIPGQEIVIPSMDGVIYRVRTGDALSKIADSYDASSSAIKRVNRLETDTLTKGQELFIPGATLSKDDRIELFGIDFCRPVGGRLTSRYGIRMHPIHKRKIFHTGVDIGRNNNQPVAAAQDGTVTFAGEKSGYGNYIVVRHAKGFVTAYGHLGRIVARSGERVKRGQTIGYVGNTGVSTGAHLHFEVRQNGKYVNPLSYVRF